MRYRCGGWSLTFGEMRLACRVVGTFQLGLGDSCRCHMTGQLWNRPAWSSAGHEDGLHGPFPLSLLESQHSLAQRPAGPDPALRDSPGSETVLLACHPGHLLSHL